MEFVKLNISTNKIPRLCIHEMDFRTLVHLIPYLIILQKKMVFLMNPSNNLNPFWLLLLDVVEEYLDSMAFIGLFSSPGLENC